MMRYQPTLPYVNSTKSWFLRYSINLKRETPDGLRPLGSRDNIGYLTINLPKTGDDPLHVLAGHPVTASDPRVFIWITALGWNPYTYSVTVNNPTDETLTVNLKPGLPVPNFNFKGCSLTLKPGEIKVLAPTEK